MQLVRFDPFTAMRDFDRLFEGRPANRWTPRVDVFDQDNALMVRSEVPGIDPASIEITVEGGTLSIKGERGFAAADTDTSYHRKEIFEGSFERTILLPDGIDPAGVTASSKDGILEISIPKKAEILPRKVSVEIQR